MDKTINKIKIIHTLAQYSLSVDEKSFPSQNIQEYQTRLNKMNGLLMDARHYYTNYVVSNKRTYNQDDLIQINKIFNKYKQYLKYVFADINILNSIKVNKMIYVYIPNNDFITFIGPDKNKYISILYHLIIDNNLDNFQANQETINQYAIKLIDFFKYISFPIDELDTNLTNKKVILTHQDKQNINVVGVTYSPASFGSLPHDPNKIYKPINTQPSKNLTTTTLTIESIQKALESLSPKNDSGLTTFDYLDMMPTKSNGSMDKKVFDDLLTTIKPLIKHLPVSHWGKLDPTS